MPFARSVDAAAERAEASGVILQIKVLGAGLTAAGHFVAANGGPTTASIFRMTHSPSGLAARRTTGR